MEQNFSFFEKCDLNSFSHGFLERAAMLAFQALY